MFYEEENTFAIQLEPYILEGDLSSHSARMPYVISEHLGDHPLSAESREIVFRWISDCTKEHEKCSNTTPSFLPTRLLDLGPGSGCLDPVLLDSTSHLSSIQGSSDASPIGYATLSHCWGKPSGGQLVTTSENLNRWKQRIPTSALSKTFADAIEIVRSLQQRYLWIDSLCIIQDSPEDWAFESSRMSDIYSNSTINIAAVAAETSEESCLRERQRVQLDLTFQENHQTPDLTHYPLWLRPLAPLQSFDPYDQYFTFQGSNLYSRAWCFQEFVLAPRNLLYCHHQIRFSCRSGERTEKRLTKEPLPAIKARKLLEIFKNGVRTERQLKYALDAWNETLTEYSSKKLTFSKDRLPAISGLARRFGQAIGGRYFAGLWERELPLALCWSSQSEGSWLRRIVPYAAPTWSWASVMGAVRNRFQIGPARIYQWDLKILDVQVQTSLDPYGEVKGGHISLEGKLAELSRTSHFVAEYNKRGDRQRVPYYDLQCSNITLNDFVHDTEEGYASEAPLWGLLMGFCLDHLSHQNYAILVLQETSQKHVFERAGFFCGYGGSCIVGEDEIGTPPPYGSAFDNVQRRKVLIL
ncbi:HET-domain-containing protein [Acephala macrosclerotiorum]|nr:HET-domain-containing protein [Acephala macrosclerotiorum]